MTLPYTQAPAEPQLKDVLDQLQKNIFLSLNCHHIGTVQSFNAANQTATVTINYKKTIYQLNAVTGLYEPVLYDYPILTDCPVIALGGAKAALTMPIQGGDECLVLFNDRDLDNWFAGATGGSVATTRLHSFSDAIILVGLRSLANVVQDYDPVRAVLRNDKAMVGVGVELIKISNDQVTLRELFQELITNVKALVAATAAITVGGGSFTNSGGPVTGTSTAPNNAGTISAISAQLDTTMSDIEGLLE